MSAALPIPVIQLLQVLTVALGAPIAADRNLPDLYALAALSAALKVVAVPLVLRRLLGRPRGNNAPDEEEPGGVTGSQTLSPASAVLAGIVLAAIGFFCFGAMQIHGSAAPATALWRHAARPGARRGQGERVHGRGHTGGEVRQQADLRTAQCFRYTGGPRPAAVERACIPRGNSPA